MNVEILDKNKRKITFDVSPEKFEEGIEIVYKKNRSSLNIPGFRKGRAPRKLIESQYGKEVFYDDAINHVLPEAYEAALKEGDFDVVSKPEIDVTSVSAEEGVVFTAEFYVKPEVTISDYKGLTYQQEPTEVSDEEIQTEIEKDREKNARIASVTDRPSREGDIININYEGFLDGVPFDGGKGEDYDLTIGSHTFIDTFEEQLIGRHAGDDVEVNVTFPEEYHSEELKGEAVTFQVEVLDVKQKELPELNDDFAQDVSEFDTLEEYKESIAKGIKERKEAGARNKKENDIMLKLIEKAEMDVPDSMIESHIDQMVRDFANRVQSQGMSLEMYLQYSGQDINAVRGMYRPNAETQVKGRLALEAVARAENLEANEDDVQKELERIAQVYGMEQEELVKVVRDEEKEALKDDIKVSKALELIMDSAVQE